MMAFVPGTPPNLIRWKSQTRVAPTPMKIVMR
jgi:hypothetical protein